MSNFERTVRIGLLQEKRLGDFEKYAQFSEEAAISDEQTGWWHRSRKYWELSYRWCGLLKDIEKQKRIRMRVAETFVSEAKAAASLDSPNYAAAAQCLQKAIEEYRRIGSMDDRIEELHKLLLEYQFLSMSQMEISSFEADISSFVEQTRAVIEGKSFEDSVLRLALMGSSLSVDKLRSQTEKGVFDYPLPFLIDEVLHNSSGKVIGRQSSMSPSVLSGNSQVPEDVLVSSMLRYSRFVRHFFSSAVIDPGRSQINTEHSVSAESFLFIVSNSSFVPPGREKIYARGLLEGLRGDFLVSTHLLIPQLEHSIRYIMVQDGHIVSKLTNQLIQDEHDINKLLSERPELQEILGADIVFDLKGLLIERFGSNLRNNMAHGLIDSEGFLASENSYLWWLTLRLCVLFSPLVKAPVS